MQPAEINDQLLVPSKGRGKSILPLRIHGYGKFLSVLKTAFRNSNATPLGASSFSTGTYWLPGILSRGGTLHDMASCIDSNQCLLSGCFLLDNYCARHESGKKFQQIGSSIRSFRITTIRSRILCLEAHPSTPY